MTRREVPYDPQPSGTKGAGHKGGGIANWPNPRVMGQTTEHSPLAVLMSLPPHANPQWSVEELLPLRDVIEDAIEFQLDDRERIVFNACIVERRSMAAIGRGLGISKPYVNKLKQNAIKKLRETLVSVPMVVQYLERHSGSPESRTN